MPSAGGAAIEQAGDIAMVEPRQDLSLGAQPIVVRATHEAGPHQFYRDLMAVFTDALGEIHIAHAAATESAAQFPRAEHLARAVYFPEEFFVPGGLRVRPVVTRDVVREQDTVERIRVVGTGGLDVGEALARPQATGACDDAGDLRLVELGHRLRMTGVGLSMDGRYRRGGTVCECHVKPPRYDPSSEETRS